MISYQIYSSRNFPPLSDTLKMLSEAGYEGTFRTVQEGVADYVRELMKS